MHTDIVMRHSVLNILGHEILTIFLYIKWAVFAKGGSSFVGMQQSTVVPGMINYSLESLKFTI